MAALLPSVMAGVQIFGNALTFNPDPETNVHRMALHLLVKPPLLGCKHPGFWDSGSGLLGSIVAGEHLCLILLWTVLGYSCAA